MVVGVFEWGVEIGCSSEGFYCEGWEIREVLGWVDCGWGGEG